MKTGWMTLAKAILRDCLPRRLANNPNMSLPTCKRKLTSSAASEPNFLTMELDDDFSNKTQTFHSWLRNSGATISDGIEIADLRQQNAGRGVGIVFKMTRISVDVLADCWNSRSIEYKDRSRTLPPPSQPFAEHEELHLLYTIP